MRAVSLGYHDIVEDGRRGESGFSVPGADRYKLSPEAFCAHLDAIAASGAPPPSLAGAPAPGEVPPLHLTFDDGGASAPATADLLEARGWRGHFLICTGYIGKPAFASAAEVRALRTRGHIVGAHSVDHPPRIDLLPDDELRAQWRESRERLEQVVGAPVTVASVPGGHFQPRVAEAAARAGLRTLYTSEPTTRGRIIAGCLVLGRFALRAGDPPALAAHLAAGRNLARQRQAAAWQARKLLKRTAGPLYERLRARLLAGEP